LGELIPGPGLCRVHTRVLYLTGDYLPHEDGCMFPIAQTRGTSWVIVHD
jgi:hypothetical protein